MTYAELRRCAATMPPTQCLYLLAFCELWQPGGDFNARLRCYRQSRNRAAQILGQMQEQAPAKLQDNFQLALTQWQRGYTLSYILGLENFAGRSFAVGPGVLVPREDSEILLQQALILGQKTARTLELCCGTACIGISLCLESSADREIWASDISPQALTYAAQNRFYYQLQNFHLRASDLFAHKDLSRQKYQLIMANPPYLSDAECQRRSSWAEPMLALLAGIDGLSVLRRLIVQARNYLLPDGVLLLEAAPWQMHELTQLLATNGYGQINIYRDTANLERVISARF